MATAHPSAPPPARPGRTRREHRIRQVPHTIDGVTVLVDEPYTVTIPLPPRDWDQIVLRGVVAATILTVAAALAWSVASIGHLLAQAAPNGVAYLAAGAFDLAWIVCMAVEWLARYDRARASTPRALGFVALGISMAAIGVHGWLFASLWVGVVGACVSALAKGMWTVAVAHAAHPLDDRTRQWVAARRAEVGGRLALMPVRREIARAEAALAAEVAFASHAEQDEHGEHEHREQDEQPASTVHAAPTLAEGTIRAAVLAAATTMPGASPEAIAEQLAHARVPVDASTVHAVLEQEQPSSEHVHASVVRMDERRPSIAEVVRACVRDGVRDLDEVVARVHAARGVEPNHDTVRLELRRALKRASA